MPTLSFIGCEQVVAAAPDTTLATTGSLRFEPDVINVIPRKAVFTVDLRAPERLVRFEPVVSMPNWPTRLGRPPSASASRTDE